MKIKNIGGATAIIEHDGVRILFDPWMDDGIFHGAWYHFPPSKVSIEELGHIDYVYISHIHEDHCSKGTIKHINRDAEIILLDKNPNFVAKFLDTHEFDFKKIHLIKPKCPVKLKENLIVDMLTGDPENPMAYAIDSTLIIKWDDFILVNANDCQPYSEGLDYILKTYKKVDLALLPYSGGSGYPSCYLNLSEEEKNIEKNRIMENRLASFVKNANYLKPRYVMPFADQYIVGGSRGYLDKFVSHPSSPYAVKEYAESKSLYSELLLLNSGQTFDFDTLKKSPDQEYKIYTQEDRENYLESLRDKKYDYEYFSLNPSVAIEKIVFYARKRLWDMQLKKAYKPSFCIYLETSDTERRFKIDLGSEHIKEEKIEAYQEPYLKVVVPSNLLMLLLVGHISWNIADAALFLDYERVPNHYDGQIYEFLNYLRI